MSAFRIIIEFFFVLTIIGTFASLVISQQKWNNKHKQNH